MTLFEISCYVYAYKIYWMDFKMPASQNPGFQPTNCNFKESWNYENALYVEINDMNTHLIQTTLILFPLVVVFQRQSRVLRL